ncbi:MAG: MarR family transcriptional regulator [Salinirussus sp.]
MPSDSGEHSERESLPPSCRCVLVLFRKEDAEALTRQHIYQETGLPSRTLSRALKTLEEAGYIETARHAEDLRKTEVVVTVNQLLRSAE